MYSVRTISRAHVIVLDMALVAFPTAAQKVGTTSMQFLKVMPIARAAAMGEAYAALANGADAAFWNPAGLASTTGFELSTTYIDWLFDTRQGALAGALSLGSWGSAGVQVQYVDYGVFEEARADLATLTQTPYPGLTGRQFRPFTMLVGVSFARSLTTKFSTGMSVKFAHETLYRQSSVAIVNSQGMTETVNTYANGVLFDFGLQYLTGFRTVRIGATVQNFGASLQYAKESSPAPLLFRLGIAAELAGANSLLLPDEEGRLTAAFDIFQPNDYGQQMHAGFEYDFAGTVAVRAGYKFNYDVEGLTLGGGIRHDIGDLILSVDYAYGAMGEFLGMSHRFSVGVIHQ